MKAQTPAEGILKTNDFGDSKWYKIVCGCGQNYHEHVVEVEADELGVNVNVYITVKTDYWRETAKTRYDIDSIWLQEFDWAWKSIFNGLIRKLKLTWELWTTGAVTAETTITMSEQQALNYAETLKSAVEDVKEFKQAKENKNGN
jgi:hypothetical protein